MVAEPEHAEPTRRSGYRYCFYSKHHGAGSSEDAQWSSDLSREEEFSVFDVADFFEITDDGWLYGVLPARGGGLRDLGTWAQQMAEFPKANEGVPWHGYPIWAVNDDAPSNRADQKVKPAKAVFLRLEQVRLISKRDRKRLWKGKHT